MSTVGLNEATIKNLPKVILKNNTANKQWNLEDKLGFVAKVIARGYYKAVAFNANNGMLYQWVCNYKIYGYNGLIPKRKGQKSKELDMKKV